MLITFIHSELQALGIEYLSAILKAKGYRTEFVVDPCFQFLNKQGAILKFMMRLRKKIVQSVLDKNPAMVAFSVNARNGPWAQEMAREIKSLSDVPIVFGGIQPTLVPEAFLRDDAVDYVIRGEADLIFTELIKRLEQNLPLDSVDGLVYKNKGRMVSNPLGVPISDLDALPFADKDILPNWFNKKLYRIITSRGCPGQCTYCCAPIINKLYSANTSSIRRRSSGNVIRELEVARERFKIERVFFEDDLFTFEYEWVEQFSLEYKRRINLPCLVHATLNTLTEPMIRLLERMQCVIVEVGVQSLNPVIRSDILKRYYSNDQIREVIKLLRQHGICCLCDNIIGLPKQNEGDLVNMVKFYNELRPGKIEILKLEYYPGAPIVKQAGLCEKKQMALCQGRLIVASQDNRHCIKMMQLIGLSYIMPRMLISFLLKYKLYRWFLPISDVNHFNQLIYYCSAVFRKDRRKILIGLRLDVVHKFRYIMEKVFRNQKCKPDLHKKRRTLLLRG
ncbi:MAG: B12-binding domain-containing radical SAM protein [Candidatus Omnitrophica bacterium]|nr:B12-binding domain-containing radical SAM protein [Candidatus Omnitrophota bacterium]